MKRALIGHSGFVGGNLRNRGDFTHFYNSSNVLEMAGEQFELVVCAGVSAVKWLANKQPDADRAKIESLQDVLRDVRADRFILISTVDVYPVNVDVDEGFDCHSQPNEPYGRNRLAFEDFIRDKFEDTFILRLPGLFGPGLKKNVIFDLLHDNQLEVINPSSRFQWYDVTSLWEDITRTIALDLRLVNLVNEPIATRDILQFFPGKHVGAAAGRAVSYDIKTRHASLYGSRAPYLKMREAVLEQIKLYVLSQVSPVTR